MAQEIVIYTPFEKMFFDGLSDPLFWQLMGGLLTCIFIYVACSIVYEKWKYRNRKMRKLG